MTSPWLLALCGGLWLSADLGYYFLAQGPARAWMEHVLVHVAAGLTVWLLRGASGHVAWALVVWMTVLNRGQSAVCGAATWAGWAGPWLPGASDLCVAWLGRDFYVALASATGAAIIVGWRYAKAGRR